MGWEGAYPLKQGIRERKKGASTERANVFFICLFDKNVLSASSVLGSIVVARDTKINKISMNSMKGNMTWSNLQRQLLLDLAIPLLVHCTVTLAHV